jgi:hypothetical protein
MPLEKAHTGFEPVLPPKAGRKPPSGSRGRVTPGSELNPHLRAVNRTAEGARSRAAQVSLGELLRAKSGEYELLAEWHAERAPIDEQHFVASQAMLVVGIVLREIAETIDVEWGEANDAY